MSIIELLISVSLGAALMVGVTDLFFAMNRLHHQANQLFDQQEKRRFLSAFLENKIQMAGDVSCLSTSKPTRARIVREWNAKKAMKKWHIDILSKTNLLELQECVRFHDKKQFMPILFFVANTNRVDKNHQPITALFYKKNHHPREELVTGINHFSVRLYRLPHSKQIRAVSIHYAKPNGVLYAAIMRAFQ